MTGGWLLWEPKSDKMIQSASVVFPQFQSAASMVPGVSKGSLSHIVNRATLGDVPTEQYFRNENTAIDTLPLTKDITIPDHLGQALYGKYRDHWRAACEHELNQMLERDVWEEVPKTRDMKTIGHHWVFDIKQHTDGRVEKFKARLVARGDRQRPGIDCTKTYAPTASLMSLRLLLAYAVHRGWSMASFDVSGAYLYSPVEETVFVEPPLQFWPHLKGKVLRLKKALYGMKQAGRCWWLFLSDILSRMGFTAMEVDQSLYTFRSGEITIAIWIHVDDGVITSNSPAELLDFRQQLCAEVEIKWHDTVARIVGLECEVGEGEVTIPQQRLTDSIMEPYPRTIVETGSPLPTLFRRIQLWMQHHFDRSLGHWRTSSAAHALTWRLRSTTWLDIPCPRQHITGTSWTT
ncbi:hypothetical protein O181_048497 [Austropuccinia psidii MF-1]|uniref:Reverse transcriptase Ty1/copia-type domain-containing protein n=1 Tax=Austropuccinia psidii MF-1 TaxID=1389203 RepID=A0A9Q3HLP5_9BASI|nr:hypothetical protein [Austropuccinia psidii MF-1]